MGLEIKSLDLAVEAAKDFLQRVITPPLEEVGLLFADQVKLWRFKNQIEILQKAEKHLKDNNINTRKVSLKVLTPMLEHASIEEDRTLQEKWADLLANTLKEGSTIDTNVFSYILSQMTLSDVKLFDFFCSRMVQKGGGGNMRYSASVISNVYTYNWNDLETFSKGSYLAVDNLIRLRLVREANTHWLSESVVSLMLTHLGFSFVQATTF